MRGHIEIKQLMGGHIISLIYYYVIVLTLENAENVLAYLNTQRIIKVITGKL